MTPPPDAGLCDSCLHSKRITSARGSVFRLCLLAERDVRFTRYPRLPVLRCEGYQRAPDAAG